MPLPTPDYLTDEFYNWDSTTRSAALIKVVGDLNTMALWDYLSGADKINFHNLVMAYALKNTLTEATALALTTSAGWAELLFEASFAAGSATGLDPARTYTANMVVDGVSIPVSATGTTASTFTELLGVMNAALGAAGAATKLGSVITVESATADNDSTVELLDNDLFKSLNGFSSFPTSFHGVSELLEVFTLNTLNGVPFINYLGGAFKDVPPKPGRTTKSSTIVYFNHADTTWYYLYDDSAVPPPP